MASSSNTPALEERPETPEGPLMKRKEDKAAWKKTVVKRKRDSGEEYVSRSTSNVMPARGVGEPCDCVKQCFQNVGEEAVQQIFTEYWRMGDHNAQSAYLAKMVTSKPVGDARVGPTSRRTATFQYTVVMNNERKVVCKKAFLAIHGTD